MFEQQADLFKALADPMRLRILALLRIREACVCELAGLLPITQPAVSQHLRKLRQAGLIQERRHKYWTYYAVRTDLDPAVAALIEQLPHVEADEKWLANHQVETSCEVMVPGESVGVTGPATKD
ncbi:MAG: metalloregulator ArsR/SmtB family transcription factor [Sulfobacillus sp.]|nr:metalloregulator ArsR/SmtB family transcription factor [Sulfobacillus sp.]